MTAKKYKKKKKKHFLINNNDDYCSSFITHVIHILWKRYIGKRKMFYIYYIFLFPIIILSLLGVTLHFTMIVNNMVHLWAYVAYT